MKRTLLLAASLTIASLMASAAYADPPHRHVRHHHRHHVHHPVNHR